MKPLPTYWRSLEEAANSPEFAEYLHREFPAYASEWPAGISRRQFLKLMGASLALAGLSACTRMPPEKIIPYVRQPEEIIPGQPLFYATALTLGGYATGVLVESHEGRPTKIEGNPLHPASLGATDAFAQAAILSLYDPERSQVVTHNGEISTWNEFLAAWKNRKGDRLRILTETCTSPAFHQQLTELLEKFPHSQWHQYEPFNRDNVYEGARQSFGETAEARYLFDEAEVVLLLDADSLSSGPGWVRYARDWAKRRRVRVGETKMSRLYVAEPVPTSTGAMADHRLILRAGEVGSLVFALARELGVGAGDYESNPWIKTVAEDLRQHGGAGIVVAGEGQPPLVHAWVHAINHALKNFGRTVQMTASVRFRPANQMESLKKLVEDMQAGEVDALVSIGGNPVENAPADLKLVEALGKVDLRVHLSLYEDDTSRVCQWHIPETHSLEAWGDARAFDGTVSIQQPLIAPLYAGKSAHEVIGALLGRAEASSHSIVRDYWKLHGLADDNLWQAALHDGVVPNTAFATKSFVPRIPTARPAIASSAVEIIFRPDPTLWDGRFVYNAWLQELPKPLTKLTWDNAALISPATAHELKVVDEDVVELLFHGRRLEMPVLIMPGQADQTILVANGYPLRTSTEPGFGDGVTILKTGRRLALARTQHHHTMEGRDLVRQSTVAEFLKNPGATGNEINQPSLYPDVKYDGHKWGMTIDLTSCVGCSACVVACQSENNIPVVGKDQVARGREMHWIRIDRYFAGSPAAPEIVFEPVTCMHCENAPCEVVCPVAATSHTDEGLNAMVYNRCIGTRYCSNNCPYKVRRFNFLQYSEQQSATLKMLRNPNVSVRTRGVMEKCTYCVQRIQSVKIRAKTADRVIQDGEIIPACAQVCPTQAIVFGDMNDDGSRVAQLKRQPHNYGLLVELNTRPRTTYLARIRNPNPELA